MVFAAFFCFFIEIPWESLKIVVFMKTKSKDQMISEMSKISGEPEEKLRLELSRMASI